MALSLAHKLAEIKPSPTLAITAQAAKLRREGKDIIALSVGEPDFDTPAHIKAAAQDALAKGFTKYTAVDGIPELKQAIIEKFKRDNQLEYNTSQILVSCGAKHSIYNLCQALLNPGDEVIIPAPYWVSYPDMVRLAEAKAVCLNTNIKQNFKITPDQLAQAITPNTRLFIINSPANPTGVSYTHEELSALGDVLLKHPNVFVMTDDIYEHIRWGDSPFVNILNACPNLADRTLVINGVSKAYAMTGWRIGYAAGPAELIAGMKKIQSQSTSNPTSISQYAAAAAIGGDQTVIKPMITAFKRRHDLVFSTLNQIPGINIIPVDSTFYSFPDFSGVIARLSNVTNDLELTELLLNEAQVALVPGTAFGSPGCMRMSFATSDETLTTALNRIRSVLER